ncbi:MAG: DNA polymerase III subunit alpha, partial [Acidimicrobiia bacterium]
KGELMAVFTLEDLTDSVECMVFPKTLQLFGHLLGEQTNDQVVLLDARVDKRDDLPKLIVGSVEVLDLSGFTETPPLRLRMSPNRLDQRLLGELKTTLVDHPGDAPVLIQLAERTVRLPDQYSVDTSNGLVGELRALLGEDCVAV